MEQKRTIGSLLVEYGIITADDLEAGLQRQKRDGGRIGEILKEMGKVTQRDVDWIISKQFDIPFIIPDEKSIDMELLSHFNKDFLLTNRILPMYATDEEVAIVIDDPFNKAAFERVSQITGRRVILSAASGEAIDDILGKILREESTPELLDQIGKLLARLKGTCFYRMDFHLRNQGSMINVFGFGIMRNMYLSDSTFTSTDVHKALTNLGQKYLYEEFEHDGGMLLLVYPAGDPLTTEATPVVLGCHGLSLPTETMFSELKSVGIPDAYQSHTPPPGYKRVCVREGCDAHEGVIYTVDSAPGDFMNCYVKVNIPRRCQDCGGAGCEACTYLGYTFRLCEGIYSQRDLMMLMREG